MIKKMAWDTFKKTGNINTFLELKQIENLEEKIKEKKIINIEKDIKKDGQYKNEWNNTI